MRRILDREEKKMRAIWLSEEYIDGMEYDVLLTKKEMAELCKEMLNVPILSNKETYDDYIKSDITIPKVSYKYRIFGITVTFKLKE